MEAGWKLTKVADNSVVMREAITSTYTANMSESFVGVTRLRLAVEGAARSNIAQGMQAVAALNL
jgi:nicotinamide mononucleotide (NMN) deamidase PncC